MHVQSQVGRTLGARLGEVCQLVERRPALSRTALARELCGVFELRDGAGRLQVAGCLKALRGLEAHGHLVLPARRRVYGGSRGWRRLAGPVPLPAALPARVELVDGLELVLVATEAEYRRWNELMLREHPLGARPLVGRQLRYLLRATAGYLGAVGFAAAALQLRDRDAWMGWDRAQRQAHLDQVVGLSRLLIRPGVDCANLASKALSLACGVVADDFAGRYGYRPWLLESFVDPQQQQGTCYRAANWLRVGATCGRGRQDQYNQAATACKDIYLYVLEPRFRDYLGVCAPCPYPPLTVGEGLEPTAWAAHEFGGAPLGDQRLEKRLITIVEGKARAPAQSYLDTVQGDRAAVAGYYRFIEAPDDSQIEMAAMLQPHQQRTLQRMHSRATVLCLHDTTDLNYATLAACEGLGVIGKNQTTTETQGLRLHTSMAVTLEEGLPLGIVTAECYAPEGREPEGPDLRQLPLEQKETYRWLHALQTCTALTAALDGTAVIHVMDREADFFELFDGWRQDGRDQLIVRAKHNRQTATGVPLFDTVAQTPVQARLTVDIPRKSPRQKKGHTAAQPARDKRRAELLLRYTATALRPSPRSLSRDRPPVPVWLVHLQEETPPTDGSKTIEWFLLTTLPVDTPAVAEKVFRSYAKRWRIEEWHRILKTCCRAEEPAHRDAECLRRVLAVNMVIAWRILLMTLLGRELPALPPHILFSDDELEVLVRISRYFRRAIPTSLNDYIVATARLGGYLQRKHDSPPGALVLAKGMTDLAGLALGFALAKLE
jgi:hypothetical protein